MICDQCRSKDDSRFVQMSTKTAVYDGPVRCLCKSCRAANKGAWRYYNQPQVKENPTMFQIEKGIEIPAATRNTVAPKYPFKQMEIGDSFFVPCAEADSKKTRNSISSSARSAGVKHVTRVAEGGLRVWRVAPKEESNGEL